MGNSHYYIFPHTSHPYANRNKEKWKWQKTLSALPQKETNLYDSSYKHVCPRSLFISPVLGFYKARPDQIRINACTTVVIMLKYEMH